ncbi:uncharacterized protein BKA55DRAFT_549281 [Fusarium redolens]|uniref:Uncharacterized protein n=1 Tax=Fusarium redolens TaxID=48865 RepID=A0A9P9KW67_FUSRE|nr:uncharacterized protein BKA55DRAFT_549281 [Fusarium redolens]KAH7269669.1 hypothetical protein BKA55DRAFT_549281 [Fusarium redolens]
MFDRVSRLFRISEWSRQIKLSHVPTVVSNSGQSECQSPGIRVSYQGGPGLEAVTFRSLW